MYPLRAAPFLFASRYLSRQTLTPTTPFPQTTEIRIEVTLTMGEMRRAIAREEEEGRRNRDRFTSTIVIAASIIAAVRLARDDISRPSPRLTSTVADSVGLAQMILQKVMR
jgi:hypothetical protein